MDPEILAQFNSINQSIAEIVGKVSAMEVHIQTLQESDKLNTEQHDSFKQQIESLLNTTQTLWEKTYNNQDNTEAAKDTAETALMVAETALDTVEAATETETNSSEAENVPAVVVESKEENPPEKRAKSARPYLI